MVESIVAVVAGSLGVVWVLVSVIRTVVIPRPERVWLTAAAFEVARRVTTAVTRPLGRERRHQLLGAFAPTVLITLPLIWSLGLFGSFSAVYWGLGIGSASNALELSASSITTLGFEPAPTLGFKLLAAFEALMGLAIVALMISFLPTIYGSFSRREIAVGRLTNRAGEPANPVTFIARLDAIGQLDRVGDKWEDWEDWFVELGETHTTFPALIYFRSARPDRSWISAAEMALDTAALLSALEMSDGTGRADTMIRSGYLALRSIADFYRLGPETTDPSKLSLTVVDFDVVLDKLEAAGITITVDRAVAWTAFVGWRVHYDQAVCDLKDLIGGVPSHWPTGQPPRNSTSPE